MYQVKYFYMNILANLRNNSLRKIILLLSSFSDEETKALSRVFWIVVLSPLVDHEINLVGHD